MSVQRTIAMVACLSLSGLALAACGDDSSESGGAEASGEETLKLRGANAVGPDSAFGKSYEAFADCLAEKSEGSLELTMFHTSTLGTDAEALELTQTGAVDFTETTLTANVVPQAAVFDLPYVFNDYDHWVRVVDGDPGQLIKDEALKQNLRILSYDLGGWRDVYGTKKIDSMDDFEGKKIRTLQSPAYIGFFEGLGAIPTPLDFTEVYLALQQGTLDAAETALPSMVDAKHYEVAKHVAITHHGMSTVSWAISQQTWDKMSENQQAVVTECDKDRVEMQRSQQLEDMEGINQFLEEQGVTLTELDTSELSAYAHENVYDDVVSDDASRALLEQVTELGGQ